MRAPLTGMRPYVTDGRNLLLLLPIHDTQDGDVFLRSLAYALQRALQVAESNVGIVRQPFHLVKQRRVAGIGGIVAMHFAWNGNRSLFSR